MQAKRDAAGGRTEARPAEVEEDGAAAPAYARAKIPIKHADDVVEAVGAPHGLMSGGGGKADRTIVAAMPGILAPAVVPAHGAHRNGRARPHHAIAPNIEGQEPMPAGGSGAVAFALQMGDAAAAERTGKDERTATQEPAMPFTRR